MFDQSVHLLLALALCAAVEFPAAAASDQKQPPSTSSLSQPAPDVPAEPSARSGRLDRLARRFAGGAPATHDTTRIEPVSADQDAAPNPSGGAATTGQAAPVSEGKALYVDNQLLRRRSRSKIDQAEGPSGAIGQSWILKTVAALGTVIGLILLLRAGFSRLSGRGSVGRDTAAMQVMCRINVGARCHVLLIRLGRRMLVVGESNSGLQTLCEISDEVEVADLLQAIAAGSPSSATQSFSNLMGRFNREYTDSQRTAEEGDDGELVIGRTRDQISSLLARVRTFGKRGGGTW